MDLLGKLSPEKDYVATETTVAKTVYEGTATEKSRIIGGEKPT